MKIQGKEHNTVKDAAAFFGVTAKTVKNWISDGVISKPGTLPYGKGEIEVFPESYLTAEKERLNKNRRNKRDNRNEDI